VCDLETSRIAAPYIYDISNLRVNNNSSEVRPFDIEILIMNIKGDDNTGLP
jgi:hypothetical protein